MNLDPIQIPFLALYAETHFKFFRFFPSFLFQKQPEILFDTPKRITPGKDVPLMLILNDIDKYPVDIINVKATISQNGSSKLVIDETDISRFLIDHPFKEQSSTYLFFISNYLFEQGTFSINATVTIQQKEKEKVSQTTILNDNLKTSSKNALTGFLAEEPYPGYEWCIYGDLHAHSQYSRSHVEFGPPVTVLDIMANRCGLSLIGITDHSYDLSCTMRDYLKPDPEVNLWKSISSEINQEKEKYRSTVILGEEISTTNTKNRVVHLGALGIRKFIPGSKDGARKQTGQEHEPAIAEAVESIEKQGGVSFASHPGARSRIMQRIFLRRGNWDKEDVHPKLNAFQAVNNGFTRSWFRARKLWIQLLLQRRKLPLIGGNDAHGDFNRYRSLGVPFLSIAESFNRYLGYIRTGVYIKDTSEEAILDAVRNGMTFVTSGPFLTISSTGYTEDCIISHDDFSQKENTVSFVGISTHEFGIPSTLSVFRGYYQSKEEKLIKLFTYDKQQLRVTEEITLDKEKGPGYLRVSLDCVKEDGIHTFAVTSPVYLK